MASVDWTALLAQYLTVDPAAIDKQTGAVTGDLLSFVGAAVQGAIEREIGRTFDVKTYSEAYDGNGRRWLYLQWDPIVSLSSVTRNGSPVLFLNPQTAPTYPLAACVVTGTRDCLELTDNTVFYVGNRNIMVTYSAGLAGPTGTSVPPDLINAGTYWASLIFRDRDKVGLGSATKMEQTTAFTHAVPKDVNRMIAAWRRFPRPSC